MNSVEIVSRLTFLVVGTFHFLFNWFVFEINYFNGVYIWKMNINSIGEAQVEALILAVLIFPFLNGLFYFIKDFKHNLQGDNN